MNFIKKYIEKQKKKSIWAWIGDIIFGLLILGLIIPTTRTPIMVFIKKATMFSPSVSVDDNYGKLSMADYEWKISNPAGEVKSLSDFKDKPIFINFWATWCPPCIAEMPDIADLEREYGDRVHFIIASQERHPLTQRFLIENSLELSSYQILEAAPSLLSSQSIPITFIIDKDGNIIVKKTGSSNWNSDSVKKLLSELAEK